MGNVLRRVARGSFCMDAQSAVLSRLGSFSIPLFASLSATFICFSAFADPPRGFTFDPSHELVTVDVPSAHDPNSRRYIQVGFMYPQDVRYLTHHGYIPGNGDVRFCKDLVTARWLAILS